MFCSLLQNIYMFYTQNEPASKKFGLYFTRDTFFSNFLPVPNYEFRKVLPQEVDHRKRCHIV